MKYYLTISLRTKSIYLREYVPEATIRESNGALTIIQINKKLAKYLAGEEQWRRQDINSFVSSTHGCLYIVL